MAWMNGNGMSAEVLRWMEKLPPEKTANPPPAIEVADAFTAQKNWSRLRRCPNGGHWGDSEYLRLACQVYAKRHSRQEGGDAEPASLRRDAKRAGEEKPELE